MGHIDRDNKDLESPRNPVTHDVTRNAEAAAIVAALRPVPADELRALLEDELDGAG
jgi:hypothetical protein